MCIPHSLHSYPPLTALPLFVTHFTSGSVGFQFFSRGISSANEHVRVVSQNNLRQHQIRQQIRIAPHAPCLLRSRIQKTAQFAGIFGSVTTGKWCHLVLDSDTAIGRTLGSVQTFPAGWSRHIWSCRPGPGLQLERVAEQIEGTWWACSYRKDGEPMAKVDLPTPVRPQSSAPGAVHSCCAAGPLSKIFDFGIPGGEVLQSHLRR